MSDFGKLNWVDLGKGCLIAVLTVVVAGLTTSLNAGRFPTLSGLGGLGLAGLSAGLAYLLKNLFTNSDNELGKK